jgi:nucleoside-diphosphate-sugar epimerase
VRNAGSNLLSRVITLNVLTYGVGFMYVIVGANGFLGSYLIKSILENTDEDIIATARKIESVQKHARVDWTYCDVDDPNSVQALAEKVNAEKRCKMIYLAAYHHPDAVAQNPKTAWNINIVALARFINTIDNIECFFYPSSDSVYGESKNGYHFKESDPLHPVNKYGMNKATAENLVTSYGYNVVRYPFLIAPSLLLHKKHFYDTIVQNLFQGRTIEMFSDSRRSSLDFGTSADLLIKLIRNYSERVPKILNLSGDDDLSKYDIGLMIAKKIGVSPDLVVPISIHKTKGIFETKRAETTLLDNTLVKTTLGLKEIKIRI